MFAKSKVKALLARNFKILLSPRAQVPDRGLPFEQIQQNPECLAAVGFQFRVAVENERRVVAGSGEQGMLNGPADQAMFRWPGGIDVNDDGKINIASSDGPSAEAAIQIIKDLTAEAEIGKTYLGKVVR